MDLQTVPYTRLLKQELPSLVRKVINAIEKHDPDRLRINTVYQQLLAQMPNVNLLTNSFGAHHLTPQIKLARKSCYSYAQWIVYNMKCFVNEPANGATMEMLNAASLVNDCLHRLVRSKNELVMIERVSAFFDAIDKDKALADLFDKLHFTDRIFSLRQAHTSLIDLLMKRTKSIADRSKLKTKEIAAPVIKALKIMFKQIEIAPISNPDLDYMLLFDELNQIIREAKSRVKRRILHNKSKAEKKKTEMLNTTNQEASTLEEPAPLTKVPIKEAASENVLKVEHEKQFEHEKPIASSPQHLQLAGIKNET